MPDPALHSDDQESTEAKLCAYLEGELSPAERVDIEQHLAANPQHRKLLVDLAKTREWMRAIPRETSPVDLGEVFQGQVERSMLLDGPVDAEAGMSISRWPQYLLVAAITALTLGLGAVLVAVLSNPRSGSVAGGARTSGTSAKTSALAPAGGIAPGGERSDATTAPARDGLTDPLGTEPPGPVISPVAAAPASIDADRNKLNSKTMLAARERETVTDADVLKARLNAAGVRLPSDLSVVCFVVSADAPATAVDHVRGFFDRHLIAFDSTPAANIETPYGRRGGFAYGATRNGEGGLGQDALQKTAAAKDNSRGGVNATQNRQFAQEGNDQFGGNNLAANNNAAAEKQSPPALALAPPATTAAETYYVAHNVTPLQLELLNASLQSNDLKQSVQRLTLPGTSATDELKQSVQPSGPIQRGQTLTVIIPQLAHPKAGTDKSNVVKVADDGTITLPMIDPLPAAGLVPAELQKRIADKYREKDLIPDATVTITEAGPPATQTMASGAGAATEPVKDATKNASRRAAAASKAMVASPPVTQPTGDPSLVNVVVVVQPSQFPVPAIAKPPAPAPPGMPGDVPAK